MDLNILKEFIQLAKDEGVSELKYETKEQKLSVSFGTSNAPIVHAAPIVSQTAKGSSSTVENTGEQFHEIKSPFVGTFYASPAPDKGAYVKVGDKVSKGQTLCILEWWYRR